MAAIVTPAKALGRQFMRDMASSYVTPDSAVLTRPARNCNPLISGRTEHDAITDVRCRRDGMDLAPFLEQRSHIPRLRIDLSNRPLRWRLPDLAPDEQRPAHRPIEIISQVAEREFGALRSTAITVELELNDPLLAKLRDE